MNTEFLKLPVDRLIVDTANVRHKAQQEGDIESLAASILAEGVVQPIFVRPPLKGDADLLGERYRVTAGRRRYLAVMHLITSGQVGSDYAIPAVVRENLDDTRAAEISLAENFHREAMDPADEVVAFRQLWDGGLTVEDIAFRFGVTERFVRQRLALCALHHDVFSQFAEGKLSIQQAQAFTVGTPEQQAEYLKIAASWGLDPRTIRQNMVDKTVRAESNIAQKITQERYVAAGGVVVSDLFGTDAWWTSLDVIEKLRGELVEEIRAKHIADGWGFCETEVEFGNTYWQSPRITGTMVADEEGQAQIDAVGAELEAMEVEGDEDDPEFQQKYRQLEWKLHDLKRKLKREVFSPEQKASAGVLLDGDLDPRFGVLREAPGAEGEGSGGGAGSSKPEKDPLAPSQALSQNLSVTLTESIREAILKDQHVALAFIAAMLSPDCNQYSGTRPGTISHSGHGRIESEKPFPEVFGELIAADDAVILSRLVEAASAGVNVTDMFFGGQHGTRMEKRQAMRTALVNATRADPVAHFKSEEFFSSSSKAVIEKAMEEMGETLAPGKKQSLVNQASAFADRYGWLPWSLRFDGYQLRKPTPPPAPKGGKKGAAKELAVPDGVTVTIVDHVGTGKPAAKPKGAKAIKVDDDVIDVFAECRTEGFKLFLGDQLERKLYEKVAKVIKKALGGRWVRHEGAHVFENEVGPMVEELLQTGSYSRTKQDFGQFDTPEEIAERAIEWAEIEEGLLVLEPSAGVGRLVSALNGAADVRIDAVEIDAGRSAALLSLGVDGNLNVFTEDFLESDLTEEGACYDRVVMNPPFAGQADIDHVRHAWEFLKPGGILVAIMSASVDFRSNKKAEDFRQFLRDHDAEIEHLDPGAFKESGTMVKTIMVKIRKPE